MNLNIQDQCSLVKQSIIYKILAVAERSFNESKLSFATWTDMAEQACFIKLHLGRKPVGKETPW